MNASPRDTAHAARRPCVGAGRRRDGAGARRGDRCFRNPGVHQDPESVARAGPGGGRRGGVPPGARAQRDRTYSRT